MNIMNHPTLVDFLLSSHHFPSLSPEACNARICGAYHLVGVREGRPLYLLPGKRAVIRYAPESDRPSMGHILLIFKGQPVGKVEL